MNKFLGEVHILNSFFLFLLQIAKTYISRATTFLTDLVQCKLLDGRVLVSDETVGRPYPIEIFVR